jgi:hypothetical protein
MKKSDMVSKIASVIINHNEPISYISREKALDMASCILEVQEELNMYPPETNLKDCTDPDFKMYADNIDIPHWIIMGWDDE